MGLNKADTVTLGPRRRQRSHELERPLWKEETAQRYPVRFKRLEKIPGSSDISWKEPEPDPRMPTICQVRGAVLDGGSREQLQGAGRC